MPQQLEKIDKNNTIIGIIFFIIIAVILGTIIRNNLNKVKYNAPEVDRPYLGNKDVKIILTEYSDFACPACKQASSLIHGLAQKYNDKIKIEYRHYPLTSIHSNSFAAAVAAECANDQGKFWEYHDKLFEVNDNSEFTNENLEKYARELNLDANAQFNQTWQTCVDSKERDKIIKQDSQQAIAFGFNGTPSFLLNGEKIKDWIKLDKIIEMKLGS